MLVSVLMPVFNYESYVEETVRSIWAQTFRNIEIIVVDDGSEDNSFEVCTRMVAASPFPMKVLQSCHAGVSGAMKLALDQAFGDLVCVVHADDVHLPEKIERQVDHFIQRPSVSLSHTEYRCIDPDGVDLGFGSAEVDLPAAEGACLSDILRLRADVRSVSMMFRRQLFQAYGGFDPGLPSEDWQAILRLAALGEVSWIADPLVLRRIHPHNKHINVSKFPEFYWGQVAPDVIAEVCPEDLDVERIIGLHVGTVIVSSISSGNVSKGFAAYRASCTRNRANGVHHIWHVVLGFLHLFWNRVAVRVVPRAVVRLLRKVRRGLRVSVLRRNRSGLTR